LGRHESGAVRVLLTESRGVRELPCEEPRSRRLARFGDADRTVRGLYFHRVMTMPVPVPGVEVMANSFERRLALARPRLRPPLVEYSSFMAVVISAIPGPSSSKIRRTARR